MFLLRMIHQTDARNDKQTSGEYCLWKSYVLEQGIIYTLTLLKEIFKIQFSRTVRKGNNVQGKERERACQFIVYMYITIIVLTFID